MRMAFGSIDGELIHVGKARVTRVARRRRMTDEQVAAVRRAWMATMRDQGCPIDEIGAMFRVTERHVYRELAALEAEDDGQRRIA